MIRTRFFSVRRLSLFVALFAGLVVMHNVVQGQVNQNHGIVPPGTKPYGRAYGEWGAEWWTWALGIPLAENPLLDETGEFAQVGQSGPVWFLAGNFGGSTERTVTVPAGKALFFPLMNSVWWAPEDLEFGAYVAEEYFGLDAEDLTDEDLIRLLANFQIDTATELTLTIDGVAMRDLEHYRAESSTFLIEDTDLLDDLGIPISEDNLSVSAGYWIMLAPLPVGEHVICFSATVDNPEFGLFELDVTYNITVAPR